MNIFCCFIYIFISPFTLAVVMFGAIAIGMAFMGDSIGGHVLQVGHVQNWCEEKISPSFMKNLIVVSNFHPCIAIFLFLGIEQFC